MGPEVLKHNNRIFLVFNNSGNIWEYLFHSHEIIRKKARQGNNFFVFFFIWLVLMIVALRKTVLFTLWYLPFKKDDEHNENIYISIMSRYIGSKISLYFWLNRHGGCNEMIRMNYIEFLCMQILWYFGCSF